MKYTIYNPSTGQIVSVFTAENNDLATLNLADSSYIQGAFDSSFYIENGQGVAKPSDPSTDLIKYDFDYETKTWQLNSIRSETLVRLNRNALLESIDSYNAIRFASLSDAQKQQLVEYRQALLDVPQQFGFPTTITWPIKPDWL